MAKEKIGVIGSGISGIIAAYLLQQRYDVILFEKNNRLGGHSNTITTHNIGIDTGFIVFNELNYPLFCKFINQLNVAYNESDMSFGYYNPLKNFWYASDFPTGLFSQKKHLLSPKFLSFLIEIKKFNTTILEKLNNNQITNISLSQFLKHHSFSKFFLDHYLFPMAAAIWSCPVHTILEYPAHTFFSFWKNHKLLTIKNRPKWRTITGGSIQYITQFLNQFSGKIYMDCPIQTIQRTAQNIQVIDTKNNKHSVDKVVIATHANDALALLEHPTPQEQALLSQWHYSTNEVTLHTDICVMPPKRNAWASWLVKQSDSTEKLTMTYYMNRLQKLQTSTDYFTSLNLSESINQSKIIKKFLSLITILALW